MGMRPPIVLRAESEGRGGQVGASARRGSRVFIFSLLVRCLLVRAQDAQAREGLLRTRAVAASQDGGTPVLRSPQAISRTYQLLAHRLLQVPPPQRPAVQP